jgi:hypothetical protein
MPSADVAPGNTIALARCPSDGAATPGVGAPTKVVRISTGIATLRIHRVMERVRTALLIWIFGPSGRWANDVSPGGQALAAPAILALTSVIGWPYEKVVKGNPTKHGRPVTPCSGKRQAALDKVLDHQRVVVTTSLPVSKHSPWTISTVSTRQVRKYCAGAT